MHDTFLPRLASAMIGRLSDVFPVTVVTGARQTGKSTLVQSPELLSGRRYLTLDDVLVRGEALRDPELLLDRAHRLAIDEVQRAPDLLIAIKRRVDENRVAGRYLLTGSTNMLIHQRISESLAGRAGYLTLWPLTRRELLGRGEAGIWSEFLEAPPSSWPDMVAAQDVAADDWRTLAMRGGYPVPAYLLDDPESRALWFAGYTATYLERDVGQIAAVENLPDLRRLMTALCLRIGGLLSQAEVARDLALAPSTVQRHLNLLELSYQLVRVPAYSVNRTKRLIKSPRVYWSDTGLAMRLAGETSPRGAHLENLILTDLLAWSGALTTRPSILHWRTSSGAEVDFVVELKNRLLPIEIKASKRIRHSDSRHLVTFLKEYADLARAGLLLYDGSDTFWIERNVLAVPWHRVI